MYGVKTLTKFARGMGGGSATPGSSEGPSGAGEKWGWGAQASTIRDATFCHMDSCHTWAYLE